MTNVTLVWFKGTRAYRTLFEELERCDEKDRLSLVRGAAVGTFLGFTPSFGIQQLAIFAIWFLFGFTRWQFNLTVAWACTWVTNPWTFAPIYVVYHYIGQFILTGSEAQSLADLFSLFSSDDLTWRNILPHIQQLVVGSLIFCVAGSLAAYRLMDRFVQKRIRARGKNR